MSVTFARADGAALPVLSVAVAAVFVAGEGGALDTAAHLTAVFVPPAAHRRRTTARRGLNNQHLELLSLLRVSCL